LLFHGNSGYENALQYYVMRTLPFLFLFHGVEPLSKLKVAHLVNSPSHMEVEGLLTLSTELVTGPYPEPDDSTNIVLQFWLRLLPSYELARQLF
jgi:hypothetical protein